MRKAILMLLVVGLVCVASQSKANESNYFCDNEDERITSPDICGGGGN